MSGCSRHKTPIPDKMRVFEARIQVEPALQGKAHAAKRTGGDQPWGNGPAEGKGISGNTISPWHRGKDHRNTEGSAAREAQMTRMISSMDLTCNHHGHS